MVKNHEILSHIREKAEDKHLELWSSEASDCAPCQCAEAQNPSVSRRHISHLQPSMFLIPIPTFQQEAKNKNDRVEIGKMKLQDLITLILFPYVTPIH